MEVGRSGGASGAVRAVMAGGSLVRLAYSTHMLAAPDRLARRGLVAATPDNAYARMTTRAFGAVHTNIALLTMWTALRNRQTRSALALNLGCDLGDEVATYLEWRTGQLPRRVAIGSGVLQAVGMTTWVALLFNRRKARPDP